MAFDDNLHIFDFAPNSHVAEEMPPEEPKGISMNGWEVTTKPSVPYRAKFRLTLEGMYWYLMDDPTVPPEQEIKPQVLDLETDMLQNAGRLQRFFLIHRTFLPFNYHHEYHGDIICRFDEPIVIPKALPNSAGLIAPFEITLVHYNPAWTETPEYPYPEEEEE